MADEAGQLAGTNPDYAIEDLYNAIADGNFPSWTLYLQVMSFEEADKWEFNPFDVTKVTGNEMPSTWWTTSPMPVASTFSFKLVEDGFGLTIF